MVRRFRIMLVFLSLCLHFIPAWAAYDEANYTRHYIRNTMWRSMYAQGCEPKKDNILYQERTIFLEKYTKPDWEAFSCIDTCIVKMRNSEPFILEDNAMVGHRLHLVDDQEHDHWYYIYNCICYKKNCRETVVRKDDYVLFVKQDYEPPTPSREWRTLRPTKAITTQEYKWKRPYNDVYLTFVVAGMIGALCLFFQIYLCIRRCITLNRHRAHTKATYEKRTGIKWMSEKKKRKWLKKQERLKIKQQQLATKGAGKRAKKQKKKKAVKEEAAVPTLAEVTPTPSISTVPESSVQDESQSNWRRCDQLPNVIADVTAASCYLQLKEISPGRIAAPEVHQTSPETMV